MRRDNVLQRCGYAQDTSDTLESSQRLSVPGDIPQNRSTSGVCPKIIDDCASVLDAAVAHAKLDRRLYGYMALAGVTLFILTFPLSALVPKLSILVRVTTYSRSETRSSSDLFRLCSFGWPSSSY